MKYFDELKRTMDWVAEQPDTIFIGQATGVPGTFMFNTISQISEDKRLELPVCESLQMQMTLGMALAGRVPISIFPRQNFLALALGDMMNMVEKLPEIAEGKAKYKMIIRTSVGPDAPVHPGHQHIGDFTDAFKKIFKNIAVTRLDEPADIFPAYQAAMKDTKHQCHLLIEVGNYYQAK